jgi:hypothetical protein
VSLSAAELAAVPPGDYVAPLRFTSRTYLSASSNFEARIRVLGLVRVSGLDAIDLGDFDGLNDLEGGDQFCIYSNNGSGAYTVTASGQGAGGAFTVSTGADTIPLALEYDDGSGYAAMNPLTALTRGNASTGNVDCGGGSNANVRVAARAADMQVALSGAYVGEITFTVAPL